MLRIKLLPQMVLMRHKEPGASARGKSLAVAYFIYEWLRANSNCGWYSFNVQELVDLTGLKRQAIFDHLGLGERAGLFRITKRNDKAGDYTIYYDGIAKVAIKFDTFIDRMFYYVPKPTNKGFTTDLKAQASKFQAVRNQELSEKAALITEKTHCRKDGGTPNKILSTGSSDWSCPQKALDSSPVVQSGSQDALRSGASLALLEKRTGVSARQNQRYLVMVHESPEIAFSKEQQKIAVPKYLYEYIRKMVQSIRTLGKQQLCEFQEVCGFSLNRLVQVGDKFFYLYTNAYNQDGLKFINPQKARARWFKLKHGRQAMNYSKKKTPSSKLSTSTQRSPATRSQSRRGEREEVKSNKPIELENPATNPKSIELETGESRKTSEPVDPRILESKPKTLENSDPISTETPKKNRNPLTQSTLDSKPGSA